MLKQAGLVAFDTVIFIYAFEQHPQYGSLTQAIFHALEMGEYQACASILALGEILTGVKKAGSQDLLIRYRNVLTRFPGLTLMNVDIHVMEVMADLRARYGIATPDAIHLASALVGKAQAFITNDLRLRKVEDLDIIILTDWESS
ncbi:MAG: PIN domain-containing protein [Anaerolineae bacterium]|nr:PIN domain-containing protein [Anaerolineae bacterium]